MQFHVQRFRLPTKKKVVNMSKGNHDNGCSQLPLAQRLQLCMQTL